MLVTLCVVVLEGCLLSVLVSQCAVILVGLLSYRVAFIACCVFSVLVTHCVVVKYAAYKVKHQTTNMKKHELEKTQT